MDPSARKSVRIGFVVGIVSSIIASVLYVRILDPLFFNYLPSMVLRVAERISQSWTDAIFLMPT